MAFSDPLLQWRCEFPILDRSVYLISHSLGAMPRRTRDRLKQYADEWDRRGIRAWEEGWWDMPVAVGDLIGKIIGAPPRTVVMHQNVSICQYDCHPQNIVSEQSVAGAEFPNAVVCKCAPDSSKRKTSWFVTMNDTISHEHVFKFCQSNCGLHSHV